MFASNPMEILGSLGAVSIIVLFILILFSASSWGIIVFKWRMFQAADREEEQFLQLFEGTQLNSKAIRRLKNAVSTLPHSSSGAVFAGLVNKSFYSKIDWQQNMSENDNLIGQHLSVSVRYLKVLREQQWPQRQYLEKVVEYIIQGKISQQESYLPFLATTGNITPFIGLFGTVVGVMNAFREIGEQGSASIAVVAPGVAEALVATAAGLFAAIPAVVAYNYFLTKIRKSSYRVEAFSIEFLNTLDGLSNEVNEAEIVR